MEDIRLTPAAEVEETIYETKKAFKINGLDEAWERVVAVVVQPGVEFSDTRIFPYESRKAEGLIESINRTDALLFEAHSTDYQHEQALKQMVKDHFAILKVGPWLTFVLREALFALQVIENEWLGRKRNVRLSMLRENIEGVMKEKPQYWQKHYHGSDEAVAFAQKYSYSDRVRYYWPQKDVQIALERLIANLEKNKPPLNLISQYMPNQYTQIREGVIENNPLSLILGRINEITAKYAFATASNGSE